MDVLVGTDFFTVDVLTLKGLVTYHVPFSIHLERGRVGVAGLTPYPDQEWIEQQTRNVSMKYLGFWPKAATGCMMGMASFVRRFARRLELPRSEQCSYLRQSEFECRCGALGTIGETGMYIAIDIGRGELAAASLDAV